MQHQIVGLNSDAVNRYNIRFTAAGLESALRQRWHTGTPCHLGHDQTKLLGWIQPISLYFEPQLTRLIGAVLYPESDEESSTLAEARRQYVRAEHLNRCKPFEGFLRSRIGTHLTADAALLEAGCPAFVDKDLARKCFPDLFSAVDKDGLIRVNDLKHVGDGIFEVDGLALFAHRYFRRSGSLLNHLNHHFFKTLLRLKEQSVDIWVALDPDLIGWPGAYQGYIELAYWWGPHFSDDLAKIETGVTRHESTDFERTYSAISRTEFWWQSRKGDHLLEVEELKNEPFAEGDYHCRYVHCVVNETSKEIEHLDGAMRSYSEEKMLERMDQSIDQAGRHAVYTKLWRIDYPIHVDEWKRLLSDYFVDNRNVGEYLGADTEDRPQLPQSASETRAGLSVLQRWVPYSIDRGAGVRVNLSYHALESTTDHARAVRPLDSVVIGDERISIVSLFTAELRKLLRHGGQNLHIPEAVSYVACEDLYVNLPVIAHDRFASVPQTLDVIRTFIRWSVKENHDRVVAFTIAYPFGDRELQLSVYGHSEDLEQYWSALFADLPTDDAQMASYADAIASVLLKPPVSSTPVPSEIIRPTGVLWLNRHTLQPDMDIDLTYCESSKAVKYKLSLPKKYADLEASLRSGDLHVRLCSIVDEVQCSRCGKNHIDCPCSVVLDGATKLIQKIRPAGVIFTDKPA